MRESRIDPFEQRRTVLRIILFVVILATIPFYGVGFWLWTTAPKDGSPIEQTPIVTNTPIGLDSTATNTLPPSYTPAPSRTPIGGIGPTPNNPIFVPTAFIPSATWTNVVVPSGTPAPTLTTIPSQTPIPTATFTPAPSNTPIPSATPLPPPSDTPNPEQTQETGA